MYPAEIYNSISLTTSNNKNNTTNTDLYISDCKSQDNEAKCLAQKFEDDYKLLQSQGEKSNRNKYLFGK